MDIFGLKVCFFLAILQYQTYVYNEIKSNPGN